MSKLSDYMSVTPKAEPYVNFQGSLRDDDVCSGFVPVQSTLDVFAFLQEATATHASCRAAICYGTYGAGKSRLCVVLERLFRCGFDTLALQPVWKRMEQREWNEQLQGLRAIMSPGSAPWRPWLTVALSEAGNAPTLDAALFRGLVKAVRVAELGNAVLGTTVFEAAAARLEVMVAEGVAYSPTEAAPYPTAEALCSALREDSDYEALHHFEQWHLERTAGVPFSAVMEASPGVAARTGELYARVAEEITAHGYAGVVVIWDEFGFAIEELLNGAKRAQRQLGVEAMALQNFVETACRGSSPLGGKVVFLGFTHVSLAEYGSRAGLDDSERDRLQVTAARFRQPDIAIRLNAAETEGYHLLSAMRVLTEAGAALLSNEFPRLKSLARRMPSLPLWERFGAEECYRSIVMPSYPLHPATASTVLLLSDRVAQVNRTAFYFMHDSGNAGFAAQIQLRDLPERSLVGSAELVRVHDLFAFFAQAVHDNQPAVHGQYEAAVAAVPGNDPAYLAVLRSVLLLKAAHVPPTTALLAFCLFDAAPEDAQASRLHDTLEFCDRAGALWRNEATGIWDFGRTAGPSVTDAIESEMAMIPRAESAYLIRTVAELQAEVAEYLGEFDIEPGPSGVVRRVRAEILDLRKGLAVAPVVNPALSDPQRTWCSACISVVVAETDELLAQWRRWVAELRPAPCYYLVPAEPVVITGDARRLWATIRLLKRGGWDDLTAAALDGQVVALRRSLANEFAAYFGSEGLRAGRCTIMRAGARTPIAAVSSWQELLLRVSEDASASYGREVRVRCGTYNEWITSGRANPISKVVAAVLSPSSASPAVSRYLGFAETSQEAAVVDGVLADNALLVPTVDGTWALRQFDGSSAEPAAEVLRVIQDHLARTGGEKQFSRLFTTLIEPPYGIPNGIIPILVACALRDQIDRIAFYERKGKGLQRVSRDDVANALVQMALRPGDYSSRYEALSGKNRVVLRAVGEAINVHFSTVQCGGDAFYDRCHDVRTELVAWARGLLDGAVATAPLNEAQRRLLRCLRNPVPPQYSELAEGLIAVFADNPACTAEIAADSAAGSGFGAIRARWSELRATLARAAEDIETPLRDVIERVTEGGAVSLKQVVSPLSFGGSPGALTPLDEAAGTPDRGAAEFVVRLSGKAAGKVGPEDYGFARGVLEAAERIRPNRDEMRVVASDRTVNLARVADQSGDSVVERHIHAIQLETGLDLPAIASLVLQRLLSSQMERPNHDEGDVRGASPEEA